MYMHTFIYIQQCLYIQTPNKVNVNKTKCHIHYSQRFASPHDTVTLNCHSNVTYNSGPVCYHGDGKYFHITTAPPMVLEGNFLI